MCLEAPHIFPVLFSFTSPAKFCYRAIAIFGKFVTGLPLATSSPVATPATDLSSPFGVSAPDQSVSSSDRRDPSSVKPGSEKSLKRSVSGTLQRATSILRREGQLNRNHTMHVVPDFKRKSKSVTPHEAEVLTAGHPGVYRDLEVGLSLLFAKSRQ